jgi:pSer/pThr/pTyr-binding forkhead associated (FHA) protein
MAAPSDPGSRPSACLEIRNGALEGRRFALEGDETLIGRGPSADVTLADEGVSREHAVLSFDEETSGWTLEDLQSTNGTRVNGKRVRSSALQSGDELQIGNTRLAFLLG